MSTVRIIIPPADRVRRRLVVDGECWLWTGATFRYGYGNIRVRRDGRWRNQGTHIVMWEEVNGPVPDGLILRHTCDRPACCRPDHLIPGTQANNIRDAIERGRMDPVAIGRMSHPNRDPATGRFTT